MELAIFLAVMALGALAVLVVQSRPGRRRRYREDVQWEIDAHVKLVETAPRRPTRSPEPVRTPQPRSDQKTVIGAKALSLAGTTSAFWSAVRGEEPGSNSSGRAS